MKNDDEQIKVKNKLYFGFKTRVIGLVFLVLLFFGFGCFLVLGAFKLNNGDEVKYSEVSKMNYNVCLTSNDIYEDECLNSGMTYNSLLVDNIKVNFNYKVDFSEDIDYELYYHVIVYNRIYDKNDSKKILYENQDVVIDKTSIDKGTNKILFDTSTVVDYKKYNAFVEKYKSKYSDDAKAHLDIVVYLDELGGERKIGSLTIPLGDKTFNIKKSELSNKNKIVKIRYEDWNDETFLYLIEGTMLIIISLILDIRLVRLVKATFTKRTKYEKELSRILREHDKLIVNAKDGYDYDTSKNIVKVENFTELIDAAEIISKPIIYSRINNVKSEFIVEDDDKLYKFVLKEANYTD